jgi:DNA replication factor GINS
MYNRLYEIWKMELEGSELTKLPTDFYAEIIDYMKKLKEESRMLDRRTAKAIILKKETLNTKRMIKEIIRARYRKIVRKAAKGEEITQDILTAEEGLIFGKMPPMAETISNFTSEILQGHLHDFGVNLKRKRIALRLLKDVPAIIGADMKPYGPFKTEDVASLPLENAKIFIKQNLAEKVEIN